MSSIWDQAAATVVANGTNNISSTAATTTITKQQSVQRPTQQDDGHSNNSHNNNSQNTNIDTGLETTMSITTANSSSESTSASSGNDKPIINTTNNYIHDTNKYVEQQQSTATIDVVRNDHHDDDDDNNIIDNTNCDNTSCSCTANIQVQVHTTPIPLSREEMASEEVRALAKKLAPIFIQADEMLSRELFSSSSSSATITKGKSNRTQRQHVVIDDDDDNIDSEMTNLQNLELMLRKEMEQAMDIDFLYNNDSKNNADDDDDDFFMTQLFPSNNYPNSPKQQPNRIEDDNTITDDNQDDDIMFWAEREESFIKKQQEQEQLQKQKQLQLQQQQQSTNISNNSNNTFVDNQKGQKKQQAQQNESYHMTSKTIDMSNQQQQSMLFDFNNTTKENSTALLSSTNSVTALNTLNAFDASTPSIPTSLMETPISTTRHHHNRWHSTTIPTPTIPSASSLSSSSSKEQQRQQRRSLSSTLYDILFSPERQSTSSNGYNIEQQVPTSNNNSNNNTRQSLLKTNNRTTNDITRYQIMETPLLFTAEDITTPSSVKPSAVEARDNNTTILQQQQQQHQRPDSNNICLYTIRDHVQALKLHNEDECGWYAVDMTKYFVTTQQSTSSGLYINDDDNDDDNNSGKSVDNENVYDTNTTTNIPTIDISNMIPPCIVKEYCLSMPESRLRRMYVGLRDGLGSSVIVKNNNNTYDKIRMDAAHSQSSNAKTKQQQQQQTLFPVRTVGIRIRPDVLCGAVMDSVCAALKNNLNAKICKRQGNHCQAFIPILKIDNDGIGTTDSSSIGAATANALYGLDMDDPFPLDGQYNQHRLHEATDNTSYYMPYFVDLQLTTYKSLQCERTLLIRVYRSDMISIDKNDNEDYDISGSSDTTNDDILITAGTDPFNSMSIPENNIIPDDQSSLHVRECGSLIQRIESHDDKNHHNNKRRIRLPQSVSRAEAEQIVSKHLLGTYRAHPSVQFGHMTIPSLNNDDYNIIKSSQKLLSVVWDELDSRDITYSSLSCARFGAFPSLPTVDVQYCSQMRKISRDSMVIQLVKSANELEEYAREAELACANMISLLRPTFDKYNIRPPNLPQAKTLAEYPLDYTPPYESCPPWGEKVQTALSRVQEMTGIANQQSAAGYSNNNNTNTLGGSHLPGTNFGFGGLSETEIIKSFDMSNQAVAMVWDAFQKQDGDEQAVRLSRKNMQVIDRLSNMERHEKLSIQVLENSIEQLSQVAYTASIDFKKQNVQAVQDVPILRWSISTSSTTNGSNGICTITPNYILLVTQSIPIIGGYTRRLFAIKDVDFDVNIVPSSIFSSSSMTITIKQQRQQQHHHQQQQLPIEVTFNPVTDGARLKSFLDVLKVTTIVQPIDLSEYFAETDIV